MPCINSAKSSVRFSNRCSKSSARLSALAILLLAAVSWPATLGAAPVCKKEIPRITLANLSPPFTDYTYFQHGEAFPFEETAAAFSPVNAWWLAEIATLIYADEAYSRQRLSGAGFRQIVFFDRAGTYAVVAANDRFAVAAFRGSEIWKRSDRFDPRQVFADFRTNIDIRLSDWDGGGRVHRGFKEALDAVWQDMAPALERFGDQGLPIWITGHSLGAALATLAADRLPAVQGLYTFGSPRVGDQAFKAHFGRHAYRVVNGEDIVTGVPTRGPFRHVGEPVVIDAQGRLHPSSELLKVTGMDPCAENDPAARAAPEGLRIDPADLIPDAIRDHVPLLYTVYLWNALLDSRAPSAAK